MTLDTERFVKELEQIFPCYPKEELDELLSRPGYCALPYDLQHYLRFCYYPNHLWQIMEFLATEEKPLDPVEFYKFWTHLTPLERIEFKHADLR
jgi:hypothetical protein